MHRNSIKAVTFDFGDTLAATSPSYFLRITNSIKAAGYSIEYREFEIAYLKTDYDIYKKHEAVGEITAEEYADWFFPILCENLGLKGDPYRVRREVRETLRRIKCGRFLLPGVKELLEYLKGEGFRLAVISNNDGQTVQKTEEVGIREYFEVIADSTNLGFIKPDSRLFHNVLKKLNISPKQALHIGDLYGSDAMGATNAGLEAIWLNNRNIEGLNTSSITEIKHLIEIKTLLEAQKESTTPRFRAV